MNEYFVDRRGRFARDGYLSLEDFIVQYAIEHRSIDLRHFIEWSSNRSIYDSSVDYEGAEVTFLDCWSRIRSDLFSGKLQSIVIGDSGEEQEVPDRFWGSFYADDILRDGKINYVKGITDDYCGRITILERNINLSGGHSCVISRVAIDAITNDEAASYTYQPLGYMNICDAFDCILKAKTTIARSSGSIGGSFAIQSLEIEKIAGNLEQDMIDKFEQGTLTVYHYQNNFDGIEKLRKINPSRLKFIIKNAKPEAGYGFHHDRDTLSDDHRWECEVSINVKQKIIDGTLVVGIEQLSSLYSEKEIRIINENASVSKTSLIKIDENKEDENTKPPKSKPSRGRPPEFDKDLFMWEAIKVLIFEEGPFPSQEALILSAAERYAALYGTRKPGDTWADPTIKDLLKKIDVNTNLNKSKRYLSRNE